MGDLESSFDQPQGGVRAPEFNSGREKLIVEIGSAGLLTPNLPGVERYLKKRGANYLGVDPDPISADVGTKPWAKLLSADIFEVEGLENRADEVWMRNLMGVRDGDFATRIFSKAFNILRRRGGLIFWDSYSGLGGEVLEQIKNILGQVGFTAIQEEDDRRSKHPFVTSLIGNDKRFNTPRVLVTAKKG
ncbi:hypothetical protein A3A75_03685 [Candidatus Woesebacteria bacterium RIFCSPLOWO2_01_FULL_39_10]|uniref:Methyltransferase type 11 domain-containing protein n=1 Tax=Candidatus Woesebacteria bacterium RIFCSPLOWO2_01_FULL_39_10 TaxID=1802516 RepID=A0A1F8B8S4_9BACT|nr:MAG: hypothetical protein A3A75_03685 [Candidatus Woesebacteria bacterium RIFCSPLOWO2_01_FULL_39_10]